jgi:spore coat protein U-like protein
MPRLRVALAACLLTAASGASAACTMSVSGPVFGTYDPFASTPLDAAGSVRFSCTSPAAILLSTGSSGSYAPRTMRSGSSTLAYNLFTDAARTSVWGDWTGGSTLRLVGAGNDQTIPIYGRVPPLQDPGPGAYGDTLIVTFYF